MKGRFAYDFVNHPDRLDSPMVRRNGNLEKASWEDAYNVISEKLKGIKSKHGADSISFISSGTVYERRKLSHAEIRQDRNWNK